MTLLLDIGNSRIKWRHRNGTSGAVVHDGAPADALRALALPQASRIWIAQVFGVGTESVLRDAVQDGSSGTVQFAATRSECAGLRIAYADPKRLGVDRWLAMLALWRARPEAFCVGSAGTALTFDAVDAEGQHLGGLIAPGLQAAVTALQSTTRFPLRDGDAAGRDTDFGHDTESCVRQGARYAAAGLLEQARQHSGGTGYLCGGDAPAILGLLTSPWTLRPDLVLEGLDVLAQLEA